MKYSENLRALRGVISSPTGPQGICGGSAPCAQISGPRRVAGESTNNRRWECVCIRGERRIIIPMATSSLDQSPHPPLPHHPPPPLPRPRTADWPEGGLIAFLGERILLQVHDIPAHNLTGAPAVVRGPARKRISAKSRAQVPSRCVRAS